MDIILVNTSQSTHIKYASFPNIYSKNNPTNEKNLARNKKTWEMRHVSMSLPRGWHVSQLRTYFSYTVIIKRSKRWRAPTWEVTCVPTRDLLFLYSNDNRVCVLWTLSTNYYICALKFYLYCIGICIHINMRKKTKKLTIIHRYKY